MINFTFNMTIVWHSEYPSSIDSMMALPFFICLIEFDDCFSFSQKYMGLVKKKKKYRLVIVISS